MENMQITTIKDALINAPNLLWSDSLFLPDTLKWGHVVAWLLLMK